MKHIISSEQFSRTALEQLFKQTEEIQADPRHYTSLLSGKVIATLFYEPSTRTRLSFESAVVRLGGKVISTENAKEMSSTIKGESLEDTIRVIQGYCDCIVLRHYQNNAADIAAAVATVPIINAGSGSGEHPTQALLDVYTIFKHKRHIDGLSIAIMGDLLFGRTIHSLVKMLALFDNIKIYGLASAPLYLPQEYIAHLQEKNVQYFACGSIHDIPKDIDVIYHTRTQSERMLNSDFTIEELVVDQAVMSRFSNDTILMHPLPRNKEISDTVDHDPRSVYFEQAHNGMYMRMCLLSDIFGCLDNR